MHQIAGCIYNKVNILSWGNTPVYSHRSAPGARTQTPISAWLASVPTVPVLRNDHWFVTFKMHREGITLKRRGLTGVVALIPGQ